jgi:hypothetical protein
VEGSVRDGGYTYAMLRLRIHTVAWEIIQEKHGVKPFGVRDSKYEDESSTKFWGVQDKYHRALVGFYLGAAIVMILKRKTLCERKNRKRTRANRSQSNTQV